MNDVEFSVLIPYRATPERELAVQWLLRRWSHFFPSAEVIIDNEDPGGVFSRSKSINRCFARSSKHVVVIVDADIWPDHRGIKKAVVRAIEHERWSRPCMRLIRLNQPATNWLVSKPVGHEFLDEIRGEMIQSKGKTCGGVIVMPTAQFKSVKMDERFVGWGGEDNRLFKQMKNKYGRPYIENWFAIHLWHPVLLDKKGRKIWPGQTRRNNKLI